MIKLLTSIVLCLSITACVTPMDEADRQHEVRMFEKAHNGKQCRVACDNAMKSFNPLTGECKCYPPEYIFKRKRRSK